jgi:hypothetical protein
MEISARAMAMIQNRTITLGSGHPFQFKMVVDGGHPKIRRPLVILKKPT